MTCQEYARDQGISEAAAKQRLAKLVKEGKATKVVRTELVYRRVRGYSEKLMPVRVTSYYLTKVD